MMNCQQATLLLSQKMDRPLTLKERCSLRFHITMCDGCNRFGRQMQQLRDITHTYMQQDVEDASQEVPPHQKDSP